MLAAVGDVPAEACLSTPPCRSAWYLVHQVGLSEVFVCAKRKVALRHISVRDLIICILRENTSILLKGVRRAQAGPAGGKRHPPGNTRLSMPITRLGSHPKRRGLACRSE